jgi:hypothetical protein
MTMPVATYAPTVRSLTRGLRETLLVGGAVVLALLALYAVFLDQGQLLTPLLGKMSFTGNYLHEFAHDGRHLFGAPCH